MSRAEELATNLALVKSEIAAYNPTLIVVTKTYPASDVEILHNLGCVNFGENRSSEGLEKSALINGTWHFQGQIQSNKIREISRWASVIHSLDSLSHAEKFSKAEKNLHVFLQVSLDGNPARGGVIESQLAPLAAKVMGLSGITLKGIMCVPPVETPPIDAYRQIAQIHQRFSAEFPQATELSAGMSNDYLIALDHGATHIRVGSKILGMRTYPQ